MNKKTVFVKIFSILLLVIGAVIMLFPFVWCLSTALQGPGRAYLTPPEFFKPPFRFDNFIRVWQEGNLADYFVNSVFLTAMCILGSVLVDSMVGYGMARYESKFMTVLFILALGTLYVPANILAVPQYVMWQKVGGLDTYLPIILPKFFGTAMGVFLMRQCFKAMPKILYEAAIIDGLHPIKIYYKIYLPLAKPMLMTLVINMFMSEWNNTFAPLIYITDKAKYPLTIGILYLRGQYMQNMELLMAAAFVSVLPLVILYLLAQKYFVQGMISSGIKG